MVLFKKKRKKLNNINVHRCKFFKYNQTTITHIDIDITKNLLTLSKINGNIEIWSIEDKLYILDEIKRNNHSDQIISTNLICNETNKSILICLHNSGIEKINLNDHNIISKSTSYGGKIYSTDIYQKRKLACACEDGSIRLYNFSQNIEYLGKISVSNENLLSICWSKDGNKIITSSSSGSISVWNEKSKKNLININNDNNLFVDDNANKPKNPVLTLKMFDEEILVTGDSKGKTSFWNILTGTLISSQKRHIGRILSIVVNENEIYSTGDDSKIVKFIKNSDGYFTTPKSYRPQKQLIKSMKIDSKTKRIFCGGNDGELSVIFLNKSFLVNKTKKVIFGKHINLSPWTKSIKTISITKKYPNLILIGLNKKLVLWGLFGSNNLNESKNIKEEKLFELKTQSVINACAIDENGEYFAFSDCESTVIFKISLINNKFKEITQIKTKLPISDQLKFTENSYLISQTSSNKTKILLAKYKKNSFDKQSEIFSSNDINEKICCFCVYSDYVVVCLKGGKVLVYFEDNLKTSFQLKDISIIIDCTFSCNGKNIYFLTENNSLTGYDLVKKTFIYWFHKYSKRIKKITNLKNKYTFMNIESCPNSESTFYVYSRKTIMKVDINKYPPPPSLNIKLKNFNEKDLTKSHKFSKTDDGAFSVENMKTIYNFEPFLFKPIKNCSAIIVEPDWKRI